MVKDNDNVTKYIVKVLHQLVLHVKIYAPDITFVVFFPPPAFAGPS